MRKQLGRKEKEDLNAQIEALYGIKECLQKKQAVNIVDEDNIVLIVIEGKATFFLDDRKQPIPTLASLLEHQFLPVIVVDMGAVKFVTGGADIMRPGIRSIPPGLAAGAVVCIVDEKHNKPLAVGTMLMSSEEMTAATAGKTVKNLHYVGDKVWKAATQE